MLIPKNHGFGTRRVPLETQLLRGLQPAQRHAGRQQGDADRAHHADRASGPAMPSTTFDIIIYATGFDALRGAFDRIDFRGEDGVTPEGEVAERRDLAGRHAAGRLPQHVHAAGAAHGAGQHPALDRVQRRMGDATCCATAQRDRHRPAPRRRPRPSRPWMEHVTEVAQRPAVHGGQFLDDRREQQRRRQADAASSRATPAARRPTAPGRTTSPRAATRA